MKKSIFTILFSLLVFIGFAQDIRFNVSGMYNRRIKKADLQNIKTMADIQKDYPKNWVSDYKYVIVSGTVNGKYKVAASENDVLNQSQKDIIQKADLGTDLEFEVKYLNVNAVTEKKVVMHMNYTLTLVPDTEAEFKDGMGGLTKYILENAVNNIPRNKQENLGNGLINFVVDETGSVSDVTLKITSGDADIDEMLLKTIANMPAWTPAKDGSGKQVKQYFQFSVGNQNGC
jgi:TonB family protein